MQTVNLPNGDTASFPDEMAKEQIESALQSHFKNQEQIPVVSQINAVGGGVAKGLANAGSKLASSLPQVSMPHVNGVPDMPGNVINKEAAPPGSASGNAMQEHPNYAISGEIAGETAPYAIPGVFSGMKANVGLGALAGAAQGTDLKSKAEGAITGAITTAGLYKLGNIVQSGISALRSPAIINNLKDWTTNQIRELAQTYHGSPAEIGAKAAADTYNTVAHGVDTLFTQFKAVGTNFDHEMYMVKRAAEDILDSSKELMSSAQQQVFKQAVNFSQADSTITQLHDIRKMLARNFDNFSLDKGEIVGKQFSHFQDLVNTQLETMAEKGGVLDAYHNANAAYQTKQLPLINAKVADVADALSQHGMRTDPVKAGEILDNWVDKNIKMDSPNRTKALLEQFDPIGRNAIEVRVLQNTMENIKNSSNPILALRNEFDKLGETAGTLFTGQNKLLVDGAKRIVNEASSMAKYKLPIPTGGFPAQVEQMGIDAVQSLANSKLGQITLRIMGEPSTPKAVLNSFIRHSGALIGGQATRMYNTGSEVSEQQDQGNQ